MLPLASASGFAVISVVVVAAGLFLWWLLRMEAEEQAGEDSGTEPDPEA
jgi:hypothetical protein